MYDKPYERIYMSYKDLMICLLYSERISYKNIEEKIETC